MLLMKLYKRHRYFLLILTVLLLTTSINKYRANTAMEKSVPAAYVSYSTESANSPWVVVNKGRQLPASYTPSPLMSPKIPLRLDASAPEMLLRRDAAMALEKLTAVAKNEGLGLMLSSGYRSYEQQVGLYNFYVNSGSKSAADAYSARPGFSEHQTGLAADIEPTSRECEVQTCFAETAEGKWLALNAYKFGFIVRYQKDNQALTGYEYEPWHIRYVGADLAAKIQTKNQTLEQFFKLPGYNTYSIKPDILKF